MGRRTRCRSAVSFCLSAGLVLASGPLLAKNMTEELGSDDAAIIGKVKSSNVWGGDGSPEGTGGVAYLPALGAPPTRVALISFYVWDCGNAKTRVYNTYSARITSSRQFDVVGVEGIAEALYDVGLTPLKESFAKHGMQLLTPDEFLDTDARKAAYEAFQIEQSAMAKFAGHFQKSDDEHMRLDGSPKGYRVLKVITNNNPNNGDWSVRTSRTGSGCPVRGRMTGRSNQAPTSSGEISTTPDYLAALGESNRGPRCLQEGHPRRAGDPAPALSSRGGVRLPSRRGRQAPGGGPGNGLPGLPLLPHENGPLLPGLDV